MSPFYISLFISVIATLVLLALKPKEHHESNTAYGIRIFVVVFIATFVVISYVGDSHGSVTQDIDVGDPPF
jgi:uncharacterized membrane protein